MKLILSFVASIAMIAAFPSGASASAYCNGCQGTDGGCNVTIEYDT